VPELAVPEPHQNQTARVSAGRAPHGMGKPDSQTETKTKTKTRTKTRTDMHSRAIASNCSMAWLPAPAPRRHALPAPSLAYYLHAHLPLPRLLRSWSPFSRARPCRLSTLPQHVLCPLLSR
jgi:hypothetical protein